MGKTFNPFKTIGSYLGLLAGYMATLKGMAPFAFLLAYLGIPIKSLLEANLIGGFIVGYAAHLFLRAVINISRYRGDKPQMREQISNKKR
ncbi:hypothetical protein GF382_01710 [Candidatus Falkowbacteria bacterium]|nr:hypothetical protein [Candidatus Falkowbacteria bacterium]